MSINEDVLRKIRKCLALSASGVPGEAEAALRQAQKLMALHGVTEGALDRSALKVVSARGKAGQAPSEWETRLVWMCCKAFGGQPLWSKGPKGGKGDADNGWWTFVAEGERSELIKYTYTVLVRKVLKARALRSEEWHVGMTRPQKAKMLDDYCAAFMGKLADKVALHALTEREGQALKDYAAGVAQGRPYAKTREASWSHEAAALLGAQDGGKESFYAAAKGTAEQLKLGGVL